MRWPRISIVTPSYNQGKYIERTVRSVFFQRYPNLDYILMDGGSTDDTMSRLTPYKDRFSFCTSEPDNGQADAIAKGFTRSSGDIMAYLNSDDLLAPNALHFVADFFERNPDVDFIYSHRCTVDENDKVIWHWILPPHCNILMKRWDYIPQETCFWRRSLFEKAGNVDPDFHFAMDYDLFVRFMNLGRVRRINRFLGAFRQHSESKTTQQLGILGRREMLKVRNKYGIGLLPRDGFFGMLLGQWVSQAGHRFVGSGRSLPGVLSGAGYDYNDFWGGLLRRSDFEGGQSELDRTDKAKKSPYDPICPVTLRFPDRLLFSIASTRSGEALTSDIYLEYRSRMAIILPSLGELWRKPKVTIVDDQVISAPEANKSDSNLLQETASKISAMVEEVGEQPHTVDRSGCAGKDRIADQILEMTGDFISAHDEIDFLDVGCYTGELLDALKARTKWKVSGIEASPSAAREAISKGHQVFEATLEEAPGLSEVTKCFDLIYLGHRIECFDEPRVSLRSLAILLNPGGLLILSTPNLDSERLKVSGPAWEHWKPGEHRFIYSKKSLKLILALAGFSMTKIWTVSCSDSVADSLNRSRNEGSEALGSVEPSDLEDGRPMGAARSRHLRWNKEGTGDVIFAICKRFS